MHVAPVNRHSTLGCVLYDFLAALNAVEYNVACTQWMGFEFNCFTNRAELVRETADSSRKLGFGALGDGAVCGSVVHCQKTL